MPVLCGVFINTCPHPSIIHVTMILRYPGTVIWRKGDPVATAVLDRWWESAGEPYGYRNRFTSQWRTKVSVLADMLGYAVVFRLITRVLHLKIHCKCVIHSVAVGAGAAVRGIPRIPRPHPAAVLPVAALPAVDQRRQPQVAVPHGRGGALVPVALAGRQLLRLASLRQQEPEGQDAAGVRPPSDAAGCSYR